MPIVNDCCSTLSLIVFRMAKRTYTADEAIALMEEMIVSDEEESDDDSFHTNSTIILQPPLEKPDAITDEDSDLEDTGDVNHLPRRILMAEASFSRKTRRPRPQKADVQGNDHVLLTINSPNSSCS